MEKKRMLVILLFIFVFIVAIILSIISYNGKYYVKFETGTNDIFLTKYVAKDGKIIKPSDPTKKGYIFKEWQLNGKTYDFDSKVNSDTVLTAKWMKEEYVKINFEYENGEIIDSIKILKGDKVDSFPKVLKDEYRFTGWTLKNKIYNGEEIYNDEVLIATFEPNKLNSNYKIGDNVIITGSYSNAAYFKSYISTKALTWERKIMNIYEDAEYPYAVGDETGITGYFQANSIEKIKTIE